MVHIKRLDRVIHIDLRRFFGKAITPLCLLTCPCVQAAFGSALEGTYRFCGSHRDRVLHIDLKKFKSELRERNLRYLGILL